MSRRRRSDIPGAFLSLDRTVRFLAVSAITGAVGAAIGLAIWLKSKP